jgi:hypothetical protein
VALGDGRLDERREPNGRRLPSGLERFANPALLAALLFAVITFAGDIEEDLNRNHATSCDIGRAVDATARGLQELRQRPDSPISVLIKAQLRQIHDQCAPGYRVPPRLQLPGFGGGGR